MKRIPELLLSRGDHSARQVSDSRRFIQRCQLYLIKSGKAQNRVKHMVYPVQTLQIGNTRGKAPRHREASFSERIADAPRNAGYCAVMTKVGTCDT